MKILFFSVNPINLNVPIQLDEEARAIDQVLRKSAVGRDFDVERHGAVRVSDIQELLLRHSPQIVHFSGHGAGDAGLVFQDEQGNAQPVSPQALTELFSILKGNIRCVVLNACLSAEQAKGIAEHIDYVIGMNAEIHDSAAICFASAFYQALGYDQPIEDAFKLGKNQLALEGLVDVDYPELFTQRNGLGANVRNIEIANIAIPRGTMLPDSPFYIERAADSKCSQILGSGDPFSLYIQAPRQVGKSSLMQRMIQNTIRSRDVKFAFVDFRNFTKEQLFDLEGFLIELCLTIGDECGVAEEIDRHFSSKRRSTLIMCRNYLFQHIVPAVQRPIVLAMDGIERLLGLPFQDDFFGMLRTWHNERARDSTYARVSLFLSSSTEPKLFIDNPHQSLFNVVEPVLLDDFSEAEVQKLSRLHGSPLSRSEVEQLMKLVAGHPFLTRLSFFLVATGRTSFDTLLSQATADNGPFSDHLDRFWHHLHKSPELQASLRQIQRAEQHLEDRKLEQLKGAGLVKRVGGKVVMRNDLYARYFAERING